MNTDEHGLRGESGYGIGIFSIVMNLPDNAKLIINFEYVLYDIEMLYDNCHAELVSAST